MLKPRHFLKKIILTLCQIYICILPHAKSNDSKSHNMSLPEFPPAQHISFRVSRKQFPLAVLSTLSLKPSKLPLTLHFLILLVLFAFPSPLIILYHLFSVPAAPTHSFFLLGVCNGIEFVNEGLHM